MLKEILQITYSVALPLVLGYIANKIKAIETAKQEHNDGLQAVQQKVDNLTRIVEENTAMACRYRIIRFDDEMTNGIEHSDDHCDQILDDIDTYDAYCSAHPDYKNHKGQGAKHRIVEADKNGTLKKSSHIGGNKND